jgi:hypothetical protein
MKIFYLLPSILVAWLLVTLPAAASVSVLALGQSTVTIPFGDWIAAIAAHAGEIVLAIAVFLMRKLPGRFMGIIDAARVDQLLEKAIEFGVNQVVGAAKGKVLTADVGSAVLSEALGYAIEHGPTSLITWAGGPDLIREKIVARLALDEQATLR